MKVNLHEFELIKTGLYKLKKDNSISKQFQDEIEILYKKILKFTVNERIKVEVNFEVKNNIK